MIRDVAARNASLANDYGATPGPHAPTAHQLAIFHGHPALGGVEISGGGYARIVVTNDGTAWPAPTGGQLTGADQVLALTSDPGETGTHFALFDNVDGTTCWDCGELATELVFVAAGDYPVTPVIGYSDEAS